MRRLVVHQCGTHAKVKTLVIDDGPGTGGTRLTGTKCCPAQYDWELACWPLVGSLARDLLEEIGNLEEEGEQ